MIARLRQIWLPASLLLALVPVFGGLGVWQWHRAEQKEQLQQEADQRAQEAPLALGPSLQPAEALQFRRVVARGEYDSSYQILLDNRMHQGAAGYFVITPLKVQGGDTCVLVNRGWVPMGVSREHLPSVDASNGMQEVSGVATVPLEKVFTLGKPEPLEHGWRPVWSHLDMKRYAASVPFSVQPVVVLLDPQASGGFVRDWARLDTGIGVHRMYSLQWFALALLSVVIVGVMVHRAGKSRRKR